MEIMEEIPQASNEQLSINEEEESKDIPQHNELFNMQATVKKCQEDKDAVLKNQYNEAKPREQEISNCEDEQWSIFHRRIFDLIEDGNKRHRKDIDLPVGKHGPA